jgi:hypothetical protein
VFGSLGAIAPGLPAFLAHHASVRLAAFTSVVHDEL